MLLLEPFHWSGEMQIIGSSHDPTAHTKSGLVLSSKTLYREGIYHLSYGQVGSVCRQQCRKSVIDFELFIIFGNACTLCYVNLIVIRHVLKVYIYIIESYQRKPSPV